MWFTTCTKVDQQVLQPVVKTAEEIIGSTLPEMRTIHTTRSLRREVQEKVQVHTSLHNKSVQQLASSDRETAEHCSLLSASLPWTITISVRYNSSELVYASLHFVTTSIYLTVCPCPTACYCFIALKLKCFLSVFIGIYAPVALEINCAVC